MGLFVELYFQAMVPLEVLYLGEYIPAGAMGK